LPEKLKVLLNQLKNNMEEKITYEEAFRELKEIVNEIEEGDISVDELSTKVKRASKLIKICKGKLTSTEEDVNKILEELQENDEIPDVTD